MKRAVYLSGIFLIFIPIFMFSFTSKKEFPDFGLSELSARSVYHIPNGIGERYGVNDIGILGGMYECLSLSRDISKIKRSSSTRGVSGALELDIDNYQLYFGIDNNEVIRFFVRKYQDDGSLEGRGFSRAVNCPLVLLNN